MTTGSHQDGDMDGRDRCEWARGDDALMRAYHDEEWGRPVRDERTLFELLTLEGAQAGLSWRTVLHRRQGYRAAFAGFDPERVARFTAEHQARLLLDPGIIRNRAKVASTVTNAQAVLRLRDDAGGLPAHLWSFVGDAPIVGRFESLADLPARTAEAEAMSRDLRKRGFAFVGPTICYALMQAGGLVNDHTLDCFAYGETKPALRVDRIRTPEEMALALAIRTRVFVEEQHVPPDEEIDRYDIDPPTNTLAVHVLGRLDGVPIATGRLLLDAHDELPHIGRVAVLAPQRGRGYGRAIMEALHTEARSLGFAGATLAAQLHALPFYERLGYVAHGPTFLDAGIQHRQMDLRWA